MESLQDIQCRLHSSCSVQFLVFCLAWGWLPEWDPLEAWPRADRPLFVWISTVSGRTIARCLLLIN